MECKQFLLEFLVLKLFSEKKLYELYRTSEFSVKSKSSAYRCQINVI